MNNRRFRTGPISLFLLLALCVSQNFLRASDENEEAADLGGGLFYFRVTNLSAQLADARTALEKHAALVVDLRGVAAGMADARALRAALMLRDAKARVARFVLINRETAAAIPITLSAGLPDGAVPGVIVIAPAAAGAPADVKTSVSNADDKAACEAIARGAELAALIDRQPGKKRYDEAVLVREHQGQAAPEDETGEPEDPEKTESRKKQPADAVLQTAAHVHRALVALKRL